MVFSSLEPFEANGGFDITVLGSSCGCGSIRFGATFKKNASMSDPFSLAWHHPHSFRSTELVYKSSPDVVLYLCVDVNLCMHAIHSCR